MTRCPHCGGTGLTRETDAAALVEAIAAVFGGTVFTASQLRAIAAADPVLGELLGGRSAKSVGKLLARLSRQGFIEAVIEDRGIIVWALRVSGKPAEEFPA